MTDNLRTGGVYFLQEQGNPDGLIKIGYASSDIAGRLGACQTGSPVRLQCIGIICGAPPVVEQRLHRRFSADRRHGEWFAPSDMLRRLIAGDAPFMVALVTLRDAASILKVSQPAAREVLKYTDASAVLETGTHLRSMTWRYWQEDLEWMATQLDHRTVEELTRKAVSATLKRLVAGRNQAIEGALAEVLPDLSPDGPGTERMLAEVYGVDSGNGSRPGATEDAASVAAREGDG